MEADNILDATGLNIAHLNVASILGAHKFEMLRLQVEDSHMDVFCASETWLNTGTPDKLVSIKGYNLARKDRSWNEMGSAVGSKKGGGLICYVREGLTMNEFRYERLNQSNRDLEMQWISLDMKHMRRIVIINVYRPPQGNYKRACKLIHESLKEADLKDNAEVFLLGDFNIDMAISTSPQAKELSYTTGVWGLKPLIKGKTRMGTNRGVLQASCIDNIFSNSEEVVKFVIADWNFSDHLMVAVKRKRAKGKHTKVEFKGRSYKNYVKEDLQEELIHSDWDDFYRSRDPALCWDIIETRIRAFLDRTCPLKSFKVKEVREPWVTNEILEEIKDKDRSLRVAKRSGMAEDWLIAKTDRNRVGRLVEQAKADFLKEQQEELVNDPKKFWRLVKDIVPGKKSKSSRISLSTMDEDGNEVDLKAEEIARFINEYFCSIGPKLAQKHTAPWRFYGDTTEESCPPFTTDFDEVWKLCKEIKSTKSSGIAEIAAKVFKQSFMVIIPQLVYLFNLSFSTGIFPDSWKRATIIPLYKGGSKTEVSNYRPVSLLPLPGKLIEKIVHARLATFLEMNRIITDRQGGFRKGFSTASSIADLTDNLFSNLNKNQISLAAFVDLRKAFDTVDHAILLKKLKCYGVTETNLKWCANYLANRTQQTLANGITSPTHAITCGVPQGSVVGPLFFILYVNDMQFAVTNANTQLYADDTVIYAAGENGETAVRKLQPALNHFSSWCQANKLTLNASKTKLMLFGTRHKVKKAKGSLVHVGGVPLQIVPSYKYLGFTLDSTLSFNHHVNTVVSMVSYKVNLLAKIRKFLTDTVALKIYKSMILPYFDYGDVIYSTANQDGLDKLQRLQNRSLKICKGLNIRYSTNALHRLTKMPMLKVRRTAHISNFMHGRLKHDFLLDNREVRTRAHDAPLFKVAVPRVETFKRAIGYAGSLQWNNLPADTRSIKDSKLFKDRQKAIMLDGL